MISLLAPVNRERRNHAGSCVERGITINKQSTFLPRTVARNRQVYLISPANLCRNNGKNRTGLVVL
jgi:hypothetical protein